jgi:hypothetical protein
MEADILGYSLLIAVDILGCSGISGTGRISLSPEFSNTVRPRAAVAETFTANITAKRNSRIASDNERNLVDRVN